MTRLLVLFTLLTCLTACLDGTNPFDTAATEENATPEAEVPSDPVVTEAPETAITTNPTAPTTTPSTQNASDGRNFLPGTDAPSPSSAIVRREDTENGNGVDAGNGFAQSYNYDSASNTFTVDNIAFDGDSGYTAILDGTGALFETGAVKAFASPATAVDGLTSASIDQLDYRALYAVGPDGDTSFAIIRTGAYIQYGFGGFIYQRDGSVTLPTTGQAFYTNPDPTQPNYVGLRDFASQGGVEYVTGNMEVTIDFEDFNSGAGVKGRINNRRIYDDDGNEITADLLAGYDPDNGLVTDLPTMVFEVNPGALDSSGELTGKVEGLNISQLSGNYYAVLSGDNAKTITGIVVVSGTDPRDGFGVVRETAGFFAVRQ